CQAVQHRSAGGCGLRCQGYSAGGASEAPGARPELSSKDHRRADGSRSGRSRAEFAEQVFVSRRTRAGGGVMAGRSTGAPDGANIETADSSQPVEFGVEMAD